MVDSYWESGDKEINDNNDGVDEMNIDVYSKRYPILWVYETPIKDGDDDEGVEQKCEQ